MSDVFLSYAREDGARASGVATALENAGLSVWWDERMVGGSEYSKEIERALRDSDAVVVLWSKTSVESPWVRDEAAKGRDSGKLIPATLDGTEPPLGFGQFHTINLALRRRSAGLRQLVSASKELVERSETGGAKTGANEQMPHAQKPQPDPITPRLTVAAAILVLILAALAFVWRPFEAETTTGLAAGKVAVGTFETVEPDPEARPIARLAAEAIERVFATNFIETVSAQSASAGAVAEADFGIRGTVDQGNDRVSLTATITDQRSGRTLWSTRLERSPQESRELTEEMAIWLADVVRCAIEATRQMRGYQSTEVSARVLRFCEAVRSRGEQYDQLPTVAQSVVDVAPNSAHAHAMLATALIVSRARPEAAYAAANKAIELDPNNGPAHWALAAVPDPTVSLRERERILRRGIEVDPKFAWNKQQLAYLMRKVGRISEARGLLAEFIAQYPLDYQQRVPLAYLTADEGAIQEARRQFRSVERLRPGFLYNAITAVRAETFFGQAAAAKNWLDRLDLSHEQKSCNVELIEAVARARSSDSGNAWEPCATGAVFIPEQALIAVGQFDRAYEGLLADVNTVDLAPTHLGPYYVFERYAATFRTDPRFMRALAELGIPQYWLETNVWPDFCKKERLPYDCREAAKKAVTSASI